MLLGNYSVIHKSPGRFRAGLGAICDNSWTKNGSLRAVHTSSISPKLWGLPTGYSQNGWMLPRVAGYVVGFSEMQLGQTGTAVMGINGDGGATIVLSGTADLSLISSATGDCTITLTVSGDMAAAFYADGSATASLTGTGSLGAIAFSSGSSSITLTTSAVITALGHMSGEMTPFTPLSPEGLANAVWNALASENNTTGTMGARVNSAASGGVDLNALAQAVWDYSIRSLTVSGGLTPEQATQLSNTIKKGDPIINLEDVFISV